MSKVMRTVRNVTKGYSSVQVKVRNGMDALTIAGLLLTVHSYQQ